MILFRSHNYLHTDPTQSESCDLKLCLRMFGVETWDLNPYLSLANQLKLTCCSPAEDICCAISVKLDSAASSLRFKPSVCWRYNSSS